jgi:hypothetical protein
MTGFFGETTLLAEVFDGHVARSVPITPLSLSAYARAVLRRPALFNIKSSGKSAAVTAPSPTSAEHGWTPAAQSALRLMRRTDYGGSCRNSSLSCVEPGTRSI